MTIKAKKKKIKKINQSTYEINIGNNRISFGDPKQSEFFPRVRTEHFRGKAKFSLGVKKGIGVEKVSLKNDVLEWEQGGVKVRQWAFEKRFNTNPTMDRIRMGSVDPVKVPISWELGNHMEYEYPTLLSYVSNARGIMYFGNELESDRMDASKIDIPSFRAGSSFGNAYVFDDGLPMFLLFLKDTHPKYSEVPQLFNQAIINVLARKGVIAYHREKKGSKLYVDNNGQHDKISSGQLAEGVWWTYLNKNIDYNLYKQYGQDGIVWTSDDVGIGLENIYPNINFDDVEEEIEDEFASLIGFIFNDRPFTVDETNKINDLIPIHQDDQWVKNRIRSDVDWYYQENIEGVEYEIELDNTNINKVPLTITQNGLRFFKQEKVTDRINMVQSIHIEGAYVGVQEDMQNTWGNKIDAEEFQTSQVFIIPRPWIKDSTGKSAWCELVIPTIHGIENFGGEDHVGDLGVLDHNEEAYILIPDSFLSTAVAPLVIDPTIGYTTVGASQKSFQNTIAIWVTFFSKPAGGVAGDQYCFDTVHAHGLWILNSSLTLGISTGGFGLEKTVHQAPPFVTTTQINNWRVLTYNDLLNDPNYTFVYNDAIKHGAFTNVGGYQLIKYTNFGGFTFGREETQFNYTTEGGIMPTNSYIATGSPINHGLSIYSTVVKRIATQVSPDEENLSFIVNLPTIEITEAELNRINQNKVLVEILKSKVDNKNYFNSRINPRVNLLSKMENIENG